MAVYVDGWLCAQWQSAATAAEFRRSFSPPLSGRICRDAQGGQFTAVADKEREDSVTRSASGTAGLCPRAV
jgi:hypothetical protein